MRSLSGFLRRQWHARPLAVFSACFLLGIVFEDHLNASIVLLAAMIVAGVALNRLLKRRNSALWLCLPLVISMLIGGTWMKLALLFNPQVPEMFSVEFSGTVISEPYLREDTQRIICTLRLSELDDQPAGHKVRLYLRSDILELTGIEYGQKLTCFGHVWPQDSATNPYQYDARKGLLANGLVGMAAAKLEDVRITPAGFSLGRMRIAVRSAISDRIESLFPANAELVKAFVIGDRNGLDDETRKEFSYTGVAHLISISGMHVSLVAMAVSELFRLFTTRRNAFLLSLFAVILYGTIVGFPPALVRAIVMFALLSFAPLAGRPSDPFTRIGAAMVLMLIIRPFSIYDSGFVLSFSASAGLLMLSEPLEALFHVDALKSEKPRAHPVGMLLQRLKRFFPELLCATLAAQIAMLPAVIAYFGAQSPISILVNLLAIPVAMTAYPLALIALLLSIVWMPLGYFAARISDGLFSVLLTLIHVFSDLPTTELRVPRYPWWLLALHCFLVIAASGMMKIDLLRRKYIPVAVLVLIGISMLNAWGQSIRFSAVFLDAGQADASIVRAEGKTHLFDVGDLYSPSGDFVSAACMSVDSVFLSHPHYDHAGGLVEILEAMPPKVIYVPVGWFEVEAAETVAEGIALAQKMQIPIVELTAGDEIRLSDNLMVKVHAPDGLVADVNGMSLVLEAVYKDRSLLFTGDLTAEFEPETLPDVNVLKVPHHGSSKACSELFLLLTQPEAAIIPVGDNNYGHPSQATVVRLESVGANVFRTDQCGAITVRFSSNGELRINTYLSQEEFE